MPDPPRSTGYHVCSFIVLVSVLVQLLLDLVHKTMLLLCLSTTTTTMCLVLATAAVTPLILAACRRVDNALLLHETVRLATRARTCGVKVATVSLQPAGLDVLLAGALFLALVGGKTAVVVGTGRLGAGIRAVGAGVAAVLSRDGGEIARTSTGDIGRGLIVGGGLLGGFALAVNMIVMGVVSSVEILTGQAIASSVQVLVISAPAVAVAVVGIQARRAAGVVQVRAAGIVQASRAAGTATHILTRRGEATVGSAVCRRGNAAGALLPGGTPAGRRHVMLGVGKSVLVCGVGSCGNGASVLAFRDAVKVARGGGVGVERLRVGGVEVTGFGGAEALAETLLITRFWIHVSGFAVFG